MCAVLEVLAKELLLVSKMLQRNDDGITELLKVVVGEKGTLLWTMRLSHKVVEVG